MSQIRDIQSVFAAFSEAYGISQDNALKIGCGLGSEVRSGEVCVAVSSSYFGSRPKYGSHKTKDDESRGICNAIIKAFRIRNGAIVCSELLSCDISTLNGRAQAIKQYLFHITYVQMVKDAADILKKLGY